MENTTDKCGEFKVNGWHLKKEVTIGQLLTLFTLAISVIFWVNSIESRIDKLSNHVMAEDKRIEEKTDLLLQNMSDRFDRYQKTVSDALLEIKGGIDRVEDKLDKKADK